MLLELASQQDTASLFDPKVYGPLYVLLVGLALGTWFIIKWVFRQQEKLQAQNAEREQGYIEIIDKQATALQNVESMRQDIKEIKYTLQNKH